MIDAFQTSGTSPGTGGHTSAPPSPQARSINSAAAPSNAHPFIPEFPIQCTGSFCHGRNIHRGPGKLCPPCRAAKLRHNKTERTRPANVRRANRTRQVLRYNRRMELMERRPWLWLTRQRGIKLWERITGMKALMPRSMWR
jgi:hypothetical protein